MKRGQVTTPILLIFELLVVAVIIFYFYQSTHREAPVALPLLDQQLTDLAIKASFHVNSVRPTSPHQKTARSVTSPNGR